MLSRWSNVTYSLFWFYCLYGHMHSSHSSDKTKFEVYICWTISKDRDVISTLGLLQHCICWVVQLGKLTDGEWNTEWIIIHSGILVDYKKNGKRYNDTNVNWKNIFQSFIMYIIPRLQCPLRARTYQMIFICPFSQECTYRQKQLSRVAFLA